MLFVSFFFWESHLFCEFIFSCNYLNWLLECKLKILCQEEVLGRCISAVTLLYFFCMYMRFSVDSYLLIIIISCVFVKIFIKTFLYVYIYINKKIVSIQIIFEDIFFRIRRIVTVALKEIWLVLFINRKHRLWPSLVAWSQQQKTCSIIFLLLETMLFILFGGQRFILFQEEGMQRVLPEQETVVLLPNALYCPFNEEKGKDFCYFRKKHK